MVNISEAASIALHSMVLIANSREQLSVAKIAEKTNTSKHHVAKIMQRLVKQNFLRSQRGPQGGFILKKEPETITMLDIYEAIEGKMIIPVCTRNNSICPYEKCIINNITRDLATQFKNYMESQMLSTFLTKDK